jgi:murein DD-endopeptidase MepM/ murein hydrolase activator NlpD
MREPSSPSSLPDPASERPRLSEIFGVRSPAQLGRDLAHVLGRLGRGFQIDPSSLGHLRPRLSLYAYGGFVPVDSRAPIMNLFDRVGGGRGYSQRVTRRRARDYRGGRLSYDEHDGVDLVCPLFTPIVAAAPGEITLWRARWLRGGLTVTVDHGGGLATQYSHLTRALLPVGTRVRRGEVIALSGASGIDLTTFFPWVPPHLHFMVWHGGIPVDPFQARGEPGRTGCWQRPNDPAPALREDTAFPPPRVDEALALSVSGRCLDPAIRREIERVRHRPASLVALLEDSLHHDRFAWPPECRGAPLRLETERPIALSLPLAWSRYRGTRLADGWRTAPAPGPATAA